MGILIMNAVSFFFIGAAYFDISSPENKTILDWLVGGFGEVFADQKFMALFSILSAQVCFSSVNVLQPRAIRL